MPKKAGTHVSRAGRKQAREKQRRAAERGLPQSEVEPSGSSRKATELILASKASAVRALDAEPQKRGLSLPIKVAGLAFLLLLAIWLVAQYRQASVGVHDTSIPAKAGTP